MVLGSSWNRMGGVNYVCFLSFRAVFLLSCRCVNRLRSFFFRCFYHPLFLSVVGFLIPLLLGGPESRAVGGAEGAARAESAVSDDIVCPFHPSSSLELSGFNTQLGIRWYFRWIFTPTS
ncbi:hypothetical protein V8C44DRAFT_159662 [Trichoderma aethiopicum]